MKIKFSKRAEKFLKNSEKDVRDRIIPKIEELSINPFPQNLKRIKGELGKVFRIRVGDYRILYEVYNKKDLMQIVNIDKRGRVYD